MSLTTTWMRLEIIILSIQAERYKYHMISLICGILKEKIQMSLYTKQKQIQRHRKITYSYQRASMVVGWGGQG